MLNTGGVTFIHLRGLELAEKLVHGQSLIASRLNDHVHLEIPHRAVKCIEQLEGVAELPKLNRLKCANYHFKY